MLNIPESCKIVTALIPQHDGALTSVLVSFKNVLKGYLVVDYGQAHADRCTITLGQGVLVAATSKVPTNVCRVWSNEDTATNDTMTAQTAAKSYQLSAATPLGKKVIFEIDPASYFDVAGDFDCAGFATAGGNAASFVSAYWALDMKYKSDTPPTAVLD